MRALRPRRRSGDLSRTPHRKRSGSTVADLSDELRQRRRTWSHYLVEDTRQSQSFVLLAGDTAKARKGTSSDRIRTIFQLADPIWAIERMQGGMSSGEGVITAVRDPQWVTRRGVEELVDAGISDKRLLLYEPEFSSVLAVLNREGSIFRAWSCVTPGTAAKCWPR